ncbi:MAG: hypothetical protein IPK13_09170 [Deltaproteobacteria bacterium]|nr:hypothetical protein [Deltaproteobacteria bacterium]
MTGTEWISTRRAGLAKRRAPIDALSRPGSKAPSAHLIAFELSSVPKSLPPDATMTRVTERIASKHRGAVLLEQQPFPFADGEVGMCALLLLRMFPCLELFQRHVLYWNAGRVDHLIATVRADRMELDAEVLAMLASYSPDRASESSRIDPGATAFHPKARPRG